jgi:hypothetical protein
MRKKATLIHADTSAARLPSPRFLTNLEARHFLFAVVKYACYIGANAAACPPMSSYLVTRFCFRLAPTLWQN